MKLLNILCESLSSIQEMKQVLKAAYLLVKEKDVSDIEAFKKDVKTALDDIREPKVQRRIGELVKNIIDKRKNNEIDWIKIEAIDEPIPKLSSNEISKLEKQLLNISINSD